MSLNKDAWRWIQQNNVKRNIFVVCCSLLIGVICGVPVAISLHNSRQIENAHVNIKQFSSLLTEKRIAKILDAVVKLSVQPQLIKTVTGELKPDNPGAFLILEHAKFLCDTSLIYLLNAKGDTVACTPYGAGKTLTGKNYAFRSYFTEPMKSGRSYSYPALGVTTGKRGIYFSAPVRLDGKNIGVVVIKVGLTFIDKELDKYPYPCAMLSEDGIVFASNRPEWLFKAAYPLSPDKKAILVASKQFAHEPLTALSVNLHDSGAKITFEGKTVVPTISPSGFHGFSYFSLFPLVSPSLVFISKICVVIAIGTWLLLSAGLIFLDRRRLFGSLKASENDYRSIIDNLRATFYRVDNEDRFIQASPAMIELYQPENCDRKGLIGCKVEKIWLHADKRKDLLVAIEQNNGKVKDFACQLVKNDGSVAHVVINASFFFDENGVKQGVEGLIYDVSEFLELQQQLLLLKSAVQAANDGITITDIEGIILWINQAYTSLTGYEADEAIGQKNSILQSGFHDDSFYAEMWQTILSGKVWRGELRNKRKNGTHYIEEMSITPVFGEDTTITNFIAIKRDISARRQEEEEKEEMLVRERMLNQRLAEEKIKNSEPEMLPAKGKFQDLTGIKILLITVNSFERLLILELLHKQNASVFSVNNCQEVLTALRNDRYELILLDQDVATMSQEINLHGTNTDKLPAILLMTIDSDDHLQQEIGADGVICKPLDPTQFFAEIARCLSVNKITGKPVDVITTHAPAGMVLDRKTALLRVMGDEKTYARLLYNFKREFQYSVSEMIKALGKGEISALKMMVHTLKGAAGGIGGDILQKTCAELEKHLAATIDHNKLVVQFDILAGYLDDLLAEITSSEEVDKAVVTHSVGNEEIAQHLFQKYGSAIETGKFLGGQQLSCELGRYDWSGCFFAEMSELQQLLDDYVFDQAATLLRQIKQKMMEHKRI